MSSTTRGEEMSLYSILDGQYSLVIGEFVKTKDDKIICEIPHYVTKQKSYIESKLRKKYNRLRLITLLLIILLTITGIKVLRKLYGMFNRWQIHRNANVEYHE
jgi:hypothetical protein